MSDKAAAATRTHRTPKKLRQQTDFLAAFTNAGNVKEAAAAAGVGRRTVYEWREKDSEFAKAWDDAEQTSHDTLEREAVRRASEGFEKPVYQGGKLVGTVREYSDTLLIFLLKARRPEKYRENPRVELTGANGGPIKTESEDRSASLADVAALLREAGALNP